MGSKAEATLDLLRSRGITTPPAVLQKMLEEVIEKLPASPFHSDPRRELTPPEVEELKKAGFDLKPKNLGKKDPVARSVTLYAGMLTTALSVREVAKLLDVNTSRIRQRLSQERTLYGLKSQSQWLVPTFQFDNGRVIPGVDEVISSLPGSLSPVAVLSWFVSPNPDLELELEPPGPETRRLSPREWLLAGYDPKVVAALAEDL